MKHTQINNSESDSWDNSSREIHRTVFEQWRRVLPTGQFGELAIRSVWSGFLDTFGDELEKGNIDTWLRQPNLEKEAYVVLAGSGTVTDGEHITRWQWHQAENLRTYQRELELFLRWVEDVNLLPLYKHAYQEHVKQSRLFLNSAIAIGSEEVMKFVQTSEDWLRMLDVPASLKQGTAALPYEDLARELLAAFGRSQAPTLNVLQGLGTWQLDEREEAYVLQWKNMQGFGTLTPGEGMRLFEVLLGRLGLAGFWQVKAEKDRHSIEVDAGSRIVWFPRDRCLTGDEIRCLPFHELVHVAGGHNGYQQECPLLGVGLPGYLATEEGVAMMAEMLGGVEFGYERHVMIAARYLAVAMMLKADDRGGTIVPRFTIQEIYDELCGYGLASSDVSKILWRIVRGTSLKHQGVMVSVRQGHRLFRLPVAEAFVKDEVYFRGFVQVLRWLGQEKGLRSGPVSGVRLADLYADSEIWRDMSRDEQVEMIQFLRPGKLSLTRMVNERNPWYEKLSRGVSENMVHYGDILNPAKM